MVVHKYLYLVTFSGEITAMGDKYKSRITKNYVFTLCGASQRGISTSFPPEPIIFLRTSACRPVAKQWLYKQRPLLVNDGISKYTAAVAE
jgi:hypothetical protein